MKQSFFSQLGITLLIFVASIITNTCFAQTNPWSEAWSYPPPPTGETGGRQTIHDKIGNVYVIGGGRDSSNIHYYSSFLLKYNTNNQLIWKREFTSFGKRGVNATGIAIDEKGRLFICGAFEGFPTTDSTTNNTLLIDTIAKSAGSYDAFLMQVDTTGHTVWLKTYGGSKGEGFGSINVLNNKIILNGYYDDTLRLGLNIIMHEQLNRQRRFYALFDTDGNPLWSKTVRDAQQITSVRITNDNTLYMTGTFSFDLFLDNVHLISYSTGAVVATGFLAKFDSLGICQWAVAQNGLLGATGQGIGGDVVPYSVIVHPNGQLSVCGSYSWCTLRFGNSPITLPLNDQQTPFLVRYSSNGTPIWAKGGQINGGYNYAEGIATDSLSNVYFTGGMNLPGMLGTDSFNESGRGKLDAFLLKYSPAGQLIWGKTAGADLEDVGSGITLSSDESSVYMVGTARSNSPMYFGNIQVPLAGNSTLFVGKTSNQPLGIPKVIKSDFAFTVFPNPATTTLNLSLPAGVPVQEAALYNTLGSLVFQWSGLPSNTALNLRFPELPAGNYTLLVRSATGTQSHCKVVINP